MQLPLFYEALVAEKDSLFSLSNETQKHAIQVLRLKEKDAILLTNGEGLICKAIITSIDKKQTIVQIDSYERINLFEHKTCIGISLLKNPSRFEWFLEKATELGISTIIPIICKRTEKQHFRYERMKTILVSAMLQSKQAWLPELKEPILFSNVLEEHNYDLKLLAHCNNSERKFLNNFKINQNTILLIGPEGDFSEEEILLAEKNNYISVSLGNNRLRTETAGVAAAVMLKLNN
ncbi:MAG: 16S rRNA (uracil(1498)-N(3))-methyltransferase [Chitinophagales bacterium]|nr:16S rRNA (uracil(1498)-N(3))-methyltransferase [Chitinophagales bacterium]